MNHNEIQDLLEPFVDDSLDPATRRIVDQHVSGCDACQAILDEVAPVDLDATSEMGMDATAVRRAIRRSTIRTIIEAAALLAFAYMTLWLVVGLIARPLLVDRGDRAQDATLATMDLGILNNPGAVASEITYDSSWLARTTTVEFSLPIGTDVEPLGVLDSRLGPIGFGDARGGTLTPYFSWGIPGSDPLDVLRRLGDGTVATVMFSYFDRPLTLEEAQTLIATDLDVSFTWAGFDVSGGVDTSGRAENAMFGYGLCVLPDRDWGQGSGGSGSAGGAFGSASIADTRDLTLTAVNNLLDHPEIASGARMDIDRLEQASSRLTSDEAKVAALVVTGPSDQILAFAAERGTNTITTLAIDFYNWGGGSCKGT